MDFSKFLKDNGIKGVEMAAYLSVSTAFISQLCSGVSKLPGDKLTLLLSNPKWDCSALTDTPAVAIAVDHSSANATVGNITVESAEIAVLKKENEMLKKMLKDREDTIELLKSLIGK